MYKSTKQISMDKIKLITLVGVLFYSFGAGAQRFMPNQLIKEELKYRMGKPHKEEKHHKNGLPDSVYRKWNAQGQKLTEGYYIQGKKHGLWWEQLTKTQHYEYLLYTYKHGIVKKIHEYAAWVEKQDTTKDWENFYTLEPDTNNFTVHKINWDAELGGGKKAAEKNWTIRNRIIVEEKRKVWENGIPWKWEHTKTLYDKNGKSLGHRKHGHWKLWNEDGTLQKETWYDMGKKLREKRYEKDKLVLDTKESKGQNIDTLSLEYQEIYVNQQLKTYSTQLFLLAGIQ